MISFVIICGRCGKGFLELTLDPLVEMSLFEPRAIGSRDYPGAYLAAAAARVDEVGVPDDMA